MEEGSRFSSVFKTEQAQFIILAHLFRKKDFLRQIAGVLKPEYFDLELHSIAAEAALSRWKSSGQVLEKDSALEAIVTTLSKALHLKDDKRHAREVIHPAQELISKIYGTLIPDEGNAIREQALKFCRRQEMFLTLQECQNSILADSEMDPSIVGGTIQKTLRRVAGEQDDIIDFYPDTSDLIHRRTKIGERRIKMGFKYLDGWMGGGMAPGTETVFMAPPKAGKSTILVNVAFASMQRGKQVVYFSHEISKEEIDFRFTARMTGLSMTQMDRDPKVLEKAMHMRASYWGTYKGKLIIKDYPIKTVTVDTLRSALYSYEGEFSFRPDLIVVDYADVMRSGKYKDSGDQERFVQADVYEGLRALAKEFDCPLITASQCNRNAVSKPIIRMEDIAESYAKCAIADHIFALCMTPAEDKRNELRIHYAGSRSGKTGGTVRCSKDWERSSVEEIDVKKESEDDE